MCKQMPSLPPVPLLLDSAFRSLSLPQGRQGSLLFAPCMKCPPLGTPIEILLLEGKAILNSRLPPQYDVEWRIGVARDEETSAENTAGILRTPAKVHVTLGFQGSASELHGANRPVFSPWLYSQA